ncbi:hypothetical protein [Rhodoferax sp. AJA081-3]|uniref:hypothetical protein n=1 Tax=Rhodoferax sp. AJA081-3 TaxID=2752316 RepID=UPI00353048E1
MKFSFVCTKPPSSGEGQVTFTSPDAYSMKMTTTSMVRGKPEKWTCKPAAAGWAATVAPSNPSPA